MPILMEGPCPKCDRAGFWWGYDRIDAEAMRQRKGCFRCQLKRTIIVALAISLATAILMRIIMGFMGPGPVIKADNTPGPMDTEQYAAVAAASGQ